MLSGTLPIKVIASIAVKQPLANEQQRALPPARKAPAANPEPIVASMRKGMT
jgi:hypothetical protein